MSTTTNRGLKKVELTDNADLTVFINDNMDKLEQVFDGPKTLSVLGIASSATPSIDTDTYGAVDITALATNITSMTTGLSGTPVNGQELIISIKDNGTSRSIAWGTSFTADGISLPTSTVAGEILTTVFRYNTNNSLNKWVCISTSVAPTGGSSAPTINSENLTADKTLVGGTDAQYQYLNPNGGNRQITLDVASSSAGDYFYIKNTDAYNDNEYLQIKLLDGTWLDRIYSGKIVGYMFDGTDWRDITPGTSWSVDTTDRNNASFGYGAQAYSSGSSFGRESNAHTSGAAFGYTANGYSYGAGFGYWANGANYGAALGYFADGYDRGVALGYQADTELKRYAMAKGYQSECSRYGEEWKCADQSTVNKYGYGQIMWTASVSNDTLTEAYLQGDASNRFTLLANSVVAFEMRVSAICSNTLDSKGWEIKGVIKRDGSNNTSLTASVVKTVLAEDTNAAAWDITVSADDTNETLKVEVKGDDTNLTKFSIEMSYSEVRI